MIMHLFLLLYILFCCLKDAKVVNHNKQNKNPYKMAKAHNKNEYFFKKCDQQFSKKNMPISCFPESLVEENVFTSNVF